MFANNLKKLLLVIIFAVLAVFGFSAASWASGINTATIATDPYGNYTITAAASDSNGSVFFGDSNGDVFRWTSSGGITEIGTDPWGNSHGSAYIMTAVSPGDGSILFMDSGDYSYGPGARLFRWTSSGGLATIGSSGGYITDGLLQATSAALGDSNHTVIFGGGGGYDGGAVLWSLATGVTNTGVSITSSGYDVSVSVIAPGDGSAIISGSSGSYGGTSYSCYRWTPSGGVVALPSPPFGLLVGVEQSGIPGTIIVGENNDSNIYRWTLSGGFTQVGTNPDGASSYAVAANDGSVLFDSSKISRWTSSGGIQDTGVSINSTACMVNVLGMPLIMSGAANSNTVSGIYLTWSPIFQYNASQSYWNQQVNYGPDNFPGEDFHVRATELDDWSNWSSTFNEYDVGSNTTFSVPMQSGKSYAVRWREVSPVSTGWSSAAYVWDAPQMSDGRASIAQITTNTATIKWPQIAPGQQMEVWWKPDSGSSWYSSGSLTGRFYQITGLNPNTKYDLCLSPYSLPNGGTGWWAGQSEFYTDSAPSVDSVIIDGGAQGTNITKATVDITAHSVDAPVVAYGLSNDGTTYQWYPYTAGQTNGLEGFYYDNPSDTAYGQVLTDYQYVGAQADSQVNISGWPSNAPSFLQSSDPGNTNWGAVWQGDIWIGQTGTYNLAIPSDDGASLTVNGQVLVDDWDIQSGPAPGSEAGTITFSAPGWYPIIIQYFQGNSGNGIQFMWEPPGQGSYTLVPSTDLLAMERGVGTQEGDTVSINNVNWSLSGNGSVTVFVKVMTDEGTISAAGQGSINLLSGAQNPNLHLSLDNGATSTTNPTVSYVLTATGAGLPTQGQQQYQINGGSWSSWVPLAQTGTITLPTTPQVDTVTFQVQDANGLESQASAQITLQPAPPPQQNGPSQNGIAGSYDGKSVYFVGNPNVSITVSNSGSPATMEYSFDSINWSQPQAYAANLSLVLSSGDGLKPVYVETFNGSGVLVGESTTYFVLDSTPPTIESLVTQSGADATSGSAINMVVQAKDNITSQANLEYGINGGTKSLMPSTGVISAPVANPGTNNIVVDIYDQAGNMASDTIQVVQLR